STAKKATPKKTAARSASAKKNATAARKPARSTAAAKKKVAKKVTKAAPAKKAPAKKKVAKKTVARKPTTPKSRSARSTPSASQIEVKSSAVTKSSVPVSVGSGLSFLAGKPGSDGSDDATHADKPRLTKTKLLTKDLDKFRHLLLLHRRQLLGDIEGMEKEALKSEGSNLSTLPVHMADVGTDMYEQEFTLDLADRGRRVIDEIDHALGKVDKKTYGICEGTGQMISKARLEARPWTRYSIEYARQRERRGIRP
ncbi:MAG: TraR/DksA C4-type zinc finger protein, partial [Planctomycetota bacterium]